MLISNPGMIDELMDSLVLNKLPTPRILGEHARRALPRRPKTSSRFCTASRTAQQLRVGVRDILGKEDVAATTGALTDIAEACLEQIVDREFEKLLPKFGEPTAWRGAREGQPCELVMLAIGKFGGRELNYHSDLDIVFLYEADGPTSSRPHAPRRTHDQPALFRRVGQRHDPRAGQLGPYGRLYEIDPRLRPTGRSGALATNYAEFERYFREGDAQLWERQALCKARVVYGSVEAARDCEAIVQALLELPPAP